MVAQELADLVAEEARYEAARLRAEQILRTATQRGTPSWNRDDLHDRSDTA